MEMTMILRMVVVVLRSVRWGASYSGNERGPGDRTSIGEVLQRDRCPGPLHPGHRVICRVSVRPSRDRRARWSPVPAVGRTGGPRTSEGGRQPPVQLGQPQRGGDTLTGAATGVGGRGEQGRHAVTCLWSAIRWSLADDTAILRGFARSAIGT